MPRKKTEPPAPARAAAPQRPAPDKAKTINDIARLAEVSKKTVSRVINHSPLVHQETRERVEAVMRQFNYTPDPFARGLAFRRSFLIGMVYDNPTAQYIVNMQYGALDAIRDSGFELVVHPCDSRNPGYIDGVHRFVQQQKLHGVMLVPRVSEDQALADMLADIGCRYSRIASVSLDEASRMVITHDRDGAAEAADYLQSLGHRDIALITGPSSYRSAHERTAGFVEALSKRGIELPAARIVEAGYTFESGVAAAELLLAGNKRPSAIFAGNDEMAAGVYKVALRAGISIPQQLSVVGFDDSPLASRLWPALSSVRLPVRDMGRIAASMLLQSEPGAASVASASVRPHLVVRDSCQPPAY
ncbi:MULTISPECIES: LacI family DNA-binding transcriptional regulator [unclassified Lysobacter]|uniref:LacI family DNA-binding transcriptional regulator n=2 Tax=Lysobacter TaxID=68 RepID=UPI001BEC5F1C|nr:MULTISPECIES: LacI family DNA-binding transcriptional regulator [unclassified Lysobacter]MBT2749405.1 LacI family DNA-binding transcriptional regulator [Lysobacter sp. ISL-42]MBT2753675.1 LacI family DNA-binding transcriptional regulator [Lysobacter sp. ISL-50]MBT2781941.1 LacI family DNA-binding transcriptional regulator [Lysobacter sp. ISL-52]